MRIRRIGAEERLTTTFPLQAYAFDASPSPGREAGMYGGQVQYHAGNVTLAADDGGTVLAAASAIPMRQNLRGTIYPMAGVAGVVTHPLARRRGLVRRLLDQLLGEMRDSGHVVSALYPFRPSFYARFGYASLPKARRVSFSPTGLAPLLRADLPGEVTLERISDGYRAYRDFTERLLGSWHGFSLFPDYHAVRLRDADRRWLALARAGGEVVGALPYRITEHGGELAAEELLAAGPLGRTLLLRFLAGHIDQVSRVSATIPPGELPELWVTDLDTVTETRAVAPMANAPMARVLSVEGLAGLAVGPGRLAVTVVDDPYLAGGYVLDGTSGKLDVARGDTGGGGATLSAAGLSALVYGVLDPEDVAVRGLGSLPGGAAAELRTLFPRRTPFLFADF
jgi:GNAT superfamily N-acetyltransferase